MILPYIALDLTVLPHDTVVIENKILIKRKRQ